MDFKGELKKLLKQYFYAKLQKERLSIRLKELQYDIDVPYKAINLEGVSSGRKSDGMPEAVFAKDEIERAIHSQINATNDALRQVMAIVEYLPGTSVERLVLEARYIDCLKWEDIADVLHISRSTCFETHDNAIEQLSNNDRVQAIIINNKNL